ncbi:hypothetical protein CC80DRAFT_470019 [Byssothecium circinans]|uniref:25S rRNA (Uridine(2843)-N(3))-methyltransferase n=1 Tax=Byssothecium circinans TaxID=147558 RepID=A0A6A5U1T9_9PLEO|nr:hypothetical protein CC80DRAFT_470019 [Byssothecium circinans]
MAPPKPKAKQTTKPPPKRSKPTTKPSSSKGKEPTATSPSQIPLDLQQLLLNIFATSFPHRLDSDIKPLLQEIKGHLFNRDFAAAFAKQEFLEAYAVRWSPSRALGYLQVLEGLRGDLELFDGNGVEDKRVGGDGDRDGMEGVRKRCKVVCLGGGAGAEIVALAGWMKMMKKEFEQEDGSRPERKEDDVDETEATAASEPNISMEIIAIDIAAWGPVVDKLTHGIITNPPLSAYASAAAKQANTALLSSGDINISFHQHDILNLPPDTLSHALQDANLVTIMFTLNELYTTSLPLTQSFLLHLTKSLHLGAILLVVDSPGSYSTVSLNGAEKRYPMHWLLEYALLGTGGRDEGERGWVKVRGEVGWWFRLQEGLRYPIELENMRMQVHLYRRV